MGPLPLSSVYSFVGCFVQSSDVLRVLAQSDELNEHKNPNTTLLKFLPAQNQKFSFHLRWTATKILTVERPKSEVLAAGPDGRVCIRTASGDAQEQIGTPNEGPSVNGLIRDMRVIGATVFAAGMGRQVYERMSGGRWNPIHGSILQPLSLKEVRGFNAIHGLDESEIVAAGWYGEIYRRRVNLWSAEDSGTNIIINDVHIVPGGTTFACGQKGTLLRDSGSGWQMIDHQVTDDEIRSLQWFRDKLYAATDEDLFAMDSHGKFKRVKVTQTGQSSFDSLHANDGVLMSVGPKDIWWTRDANKWHRLD
jgi:hypothetical protein